MLQRWRLGLVGAGIVGALACAAGAQTQASPDPVAQLQARLERGEAQLAWRDDGTGYLKSLLDQLAIPVESQVLVFSKTSLQAAEINPKAPRAVYFNDDVSVGAVQGGRLIEVLTVDPVDGLAFYSAPATKTANPRIEREANACRDCHGHLNKWSVGMIVANVIPQADGAPLFTHTDRLFDVTDHRTPYEQRWGGWYVTGQHGAMRHAGNVFAAPESPAELDPHAGQNLMDLSSKIDVARYLAPSSDIVALMTLEHQVGASNLIGVVNSQIRSLTERPEGERATQAEVDASIEELVDYLLFLGEPPLPSPVTGASDFARRFSTSGPFDAKGRSLRALDLKTRLARYPLSYMIYSRAFASLRPSARDRVYARLLAVLSGADTAPKYAGLSPAARRAALEIAVATKPDLPEAWRRAAS